MHKEYIEREVALKALCSKCCEDSTENPSACEGCEQWIEIFKVPAVDVAPLVHGRWIPHEVEQTLESNFNPYHTIEKFVPLNYRCSLCGRIEDNKEPYCHCGAKMDGDK